MPAPSQPLPTVGLPASTEDAKVRAALAELQAILTAGIDSSNLLPAFLTALLIPTGTILMTGAAAADTGWLLCDGSAVSRTTYAALFAKIGTTYGVGDNSTTFNLPDLKGRSPMGAGAGSGLTARTLGAKIGGETHAHTVANHTHGVSAESPGTNVAGAHTHGVLVGATGAFSPGNLGSGAAFSYPNYNHTHSGNTDSQGDHSHTVNSHSHGGATGGATPATDAQSIIQPGQVVNFQIKT